MSSHFSAIGFPIKNSTDLAKLAQDVLDRGTSFEVADGSYACWRDESGAELWAQLDENHQLIGLNPHFAGKATMRIGLVGKVSRADDSPLDGAYEAWADPEEGKPDKGAYPFVFDSPNFFIKKVEFPQITTVQLAAMPHEFHTYRDEGAFKDNKLHLASEAFIPSGLFSPGFEKIEPPAAQAIFAGKVIECAILRNSYTRQKYQWALVRTLGGEIDVVQEHGPFSKQLKVGNIVMGQFWLSGKLGGGSIKDGSPA